MIISKNYKIKTQGAEVTSALKSTEDTYNSDLYLNKKSHQPTQLLRYNSTLLQGMVDTIGIFQPNYSISTLLQLYYYTTIHLH